MPHAALWVVQQNGTRRSECRRVVSMPHAALWVVQLDDGKRACKGFAFQCRTRLCGWCSLESGDLEICKKYVSMPHAALWVVQRSMRSSKKTSRIVSMPHAALWVVQRQCSQDSRRVISFQCRTRLCGWCSPEEIDYSAEIICFNAARGFVGGAASSLAALVPLREKSPFGKSPEI